jgi:DNA-binding response OmpR family regulator
VGERETMVLGGLELRPLARAVLVNVQDVPLTTAEFDIVMMLAEHPGWVYSPEQLSGDPIDAELSPESVSVLVSRLRHKLSEAGLPDVVETVRGFGYRLRAPD